ncbi:hypothetical protein ERJ75_001248000 [Trypanosoma vivax]|uniref:Uncharacterized protein n=1 Tax=Trypanosoma vivax (strain Y486) TaxID=1055687 RepID=G0UD27_TRYVY|nr:hypothetical protein TRVL_06176 [Trypanosoma vivax]KAH8608837.1 hypothetical protein ERJ75_001248000 [Trypanosoma vivax]CCC53737.1 conserved hypothetical protein [Trypanosoma vivax Y486]
MQAKSLFNSGSLATYTQLSSVLTLSHEVVNRVAMERNEDGLFSYHVSKRDYNLVMNHISPRLPPLPQHQSNIDEDELSMYCSSTQGSLSNTMTKIVDDGIDCSEIDEQLLEMAKKRREQDMSRTKSWRRQEKQSMKDLMIARESKARSDVEFLEKSLYRRILAAFGENSGLETLDFFLNEVKCRKKIIDEWTTESLPFLNCCSREQTDYMEQFLIRSLRGKGASLRKTEEEVPFEKIPLDIRLYVPLQERCDAIRRETEYEEEIAQYYLFLGEATQRDLVAAGMMRKNEVSGLIESVKQPIDFQNWDPVDTAFSTEFRYLQAEEETERMKIIEALLDDMGKMYAEHHEVILALTPKRRSY